ncbi:integral peroxisomal membrane peroxin protein [Rutstroemia sp. NJR-2017a BVV2]|nr:integral peroxisomal membrane peroxin protein [Rutstroemia sp. NJR-2017a BVV2]
MDEDDSIPAIRIDPADEHADELESLPDNHDPTQKEGARQRFRRHKSALKENIKKAQDKASETSASVQDRLLEKLLQQVIPLEDPSQNRPDAATPTNFVERPPFNITTMSNNFRRFNARIGVVFVFQAKVIRLLSWKQWSHTLSFLAVYTFVCLDPYLLTVLPLAILLLAILIPSFIARHPAPPTTISSDSYTYSTSGPPIAPAPTVKPVKELSKDFFRNMRDLQNCMEDFSRLHDQILSILTPSTNFSNEPLSSTLFLFLVVTAAFMFIASHLMPWRLIFLIIGWTITSLGHPTIQRQMLTTHTTIIQPRSAPLASQLQSFIDQDIILDSAPETREVEIFELQRRTRAGEWEHWLFSSSPFDPLSSMRMDAGRPVGCRFFEDVRAPRGWEWSEKKWALDLWSREWVEERIITGVEVETEGERWVYDIRYEGEGGADAGEGEGEGSGSGSGSGSGYNSIGRAGGGKKGLTISWEEGSDVDGSWDGRRGDWRRRRWVRMVKRRYEVRGEGGEDAK